MNDDSVKIDVKSRIIQEATRLFATVGFNGTSVQAVAEAVGIRKPSLLYHFPSKDQLRTEVIEELLSHWTREFPRMMHSATSGTDRLNAALTALIGFFQEDRNRARLFVRETLDRPQAVRELLHQHLGPWTRMLTDYIRLGQDSGVVHKDLDPESYIIEVVLMTLCTTAAGSVTAAILDSEAVPSVESQLREVTRIARCALFVPRPPGG